MRQYHLPGFQYNAQNIHVHWVAAFQASTHCSCLCTIGTHCCYDTKTKELTTYQEKRFGDCIAYNQLKSDPDVTNTWTKLLKKISTIHMDYPQIKRIYIPPIYKIWKSQNCCHGATLCVKIDPIHCSTCIFVSLVLLSIKFRTHVKIMKTPFFFF